MTAATQPMMADRSDWRTLVGAGVKLGGLTAAGVAAFSVLSSSLSGTAEAVVQIVLVLIGGAAFAYLPAHWVRPRTVDGIAWAAMAGLLGALVFSVVDIALFRNIGVYHWRWDALGGGSSFWYLPVWWMGSALLAWLGGWIIAIKERDGSELLVTAAQTEGLAIVLFFVLALVLSQVNAPLMALAYVLALVVHVPLTAVLNRK